MRKSVIIKLLLFLILISFLSVDYASGENKGDAITWDKTFGGNSEDMGFSIIQTENGGYAIAGYTILDREKRKDTWRAKLGYIVLTEDKRQDIWIIKLGENGNKEWEKTFDKDENDIANSIVQTRDGGYVITGGTGKRLWGEVSCWVIKLDAKGNMEWDNDFGGIGWDEIYSIIQTKDGGFITTGSTWSKGAGRGDVCVVKLDRRGYLVWIKTFGGSDYDEAHSIIQTDDGSYTVAGFTISEDTGDRDVWVIKLDENGNLQ